MARFLARALGEAAALAQNLVASGANSRQISRALTKSFSDIPLATRQRIANEAIFTFQAKQNIANFLASGGRITQFTNVAQLLGCPPGTTRVAMVVGANVASTVGGSQRQFYGEVEVQIAGAGRNTLQSVVGQAYGSVLQQMRDKGYSPGTNAVSVNGTQQTVVNVTNIRCI